MSEPPELMQSATATNDPILAKFRKALDKLYGSRIERVVLFGSRARGDPQPDSDYDVAVFLHHLTDRSGEVRRLADLQHRVMTVTDPYIDVIPFPAGTWSDRTTFMHELRREGLDL